MLSFDLQLSGHGEVQESQRGSPGGHVAREVPGSNWGESDKWMFMGKYITEYIQSKFVKCHSTAVDTRYLIQLWTKNSYLYGIIHYLVK